MLELLSGCFPHSVLMVTSTTNITTGPMSIFYSNFRIFCFLFFFSVLFPFGLFAFVYDARCMQFSVFSIPFGQTNIWYPVRVGLCLCDGAWERERERKKEKTGRQSATSHYHIFYTTCDKRAHTQTLYVRLRAKMGRIKNFRKAGYIFEENNNDIYHFKAQEWHISICVALPLNKYLCCLSSDKI